MTCLLLVCLVFKEECGTEWGTLSSSLANLFKLFCLQSSAVATSMAANCNESNLLHVVQDPFHLVGATQ